MADIIEKMKDLGVKILRDREGVDIFFNNNFGYIRIKEDGVYFGNTNKQSVVIMSHDQYHNSLFEFKLDYDRSLRNSINHRTEEISYGIDLKVNTDKREFEVFYKLSKVKGHPCKNERNQTSETLIDFFKFISKEVNHFRSEKTMEVLF